MHLFSVRSIWRTSEAALCILAIILLSGCLGSGNACPVCCPVCCPIHSPLQMVAVLLTGNGVAWLLFCSLWGSLPFRWGAPSAALPPAWPPPRGNHQFTLKNAEHSRPALLCTPCPAAT